MSIQFSFLEIFSCQIISISIKNLTDFKYFNSISNLEYQFEMFIEIIES